MIVYFIYRTGELKPLIWKVSLMSVVVSTNYWKKNVT